MGVSEPTFQRYDISEASRYYVAENLRLSEGHVFTLGHVAAETALDQHIEAAQRLAAFLLASEDKRKSAFAHFTQMYTFRQDTLHRHALYHRCHDATARIFVSLRAEQDCSSSEDLVRWIVQGLGLLPAQSVIPLTLSTTRTLLKQHKSAAMNYERARRPQAFRHCVIGDRYSSIDCLESILRYPLQCILWLTRFLLLNLKCCQRPWHNFSTTYLSVLTYTLEPHE